MRIGQLAPQQVLPVNAGTQRLRGLAVSQALGKPPHGDEGEAPWEQTGLATQRKECGKVLFPMDGAEFVT